MAILRIHDEISRVVTGYFENGQRDLSVVCNWNDVREVDGRKHWNEQALLNARMHDPDYAVFARFIDPETHVLDIGAHFGYSAASIWASHCKSKVFSFEVNPAYTGVLKSLVDLRGNQFAFRIIGLSDSNARSTLVVPVLNQRLLGAFSTMDLRPSVDGLVRHATNYYDKYLQHEPFCSFRLCSLSVVTSPLDYLLDKTDLRETLGQIAAVKVDVEGFEANVLRGARNTLRWHKPLVIAERGGDWLAVNDFMASQDYRLASRKDSSLICTDRPSNSLNQFFVHRARLQEYLSIGLVRTISPGVIFESH